MNIIFATGNKGKMREIREIFPEDRYRLLSMGEAGFTGEIEENGKTFEENALIKVRAIGKRPDTVVLSDDSGLLIDAFDGAPGVYSARYLGEDTPYEEKNRVILERMSGLKEENRTCRYVCVIAALFPDGTEKTVSASMEGRIAFEAKGEGGFGYDPIFFLPEFKRTAAELQAFEKNSVSHRGKALRMMAKELSNWEKTHA